MRAIGLRGAPRVTALLNSRTPRVQCERRKESRWGQFGPTPENEDSACPQLTLSVPPFADDNRTSRRAKECDRCGLGDGDYLGAFPGWLLLRTLGLFIRRAENLRRKQGQDEHQKGDSLHVKVSRQR